jgi:hypothetical protein
MRILFYSLFSVIVVVAIFSTIFTVTLLIRGTDIKPVLMQAEVEPENVVNPELLKGEITLTLKDAHFIYYVTNEGKKILVTPTPAVPFDKHQFSSDELSTGFLEIISGSKDVFAQQCTSWACSGTYIDPIGFMRPRCWCTS